MHIMTFYHNASNNSIGIMIYQCHKLLLQSKYWSKLVHFHFHFLYLIEFIQVKIFNGKLKIILVSDTKEAP